MPAVTTRFDRTKQDMRKGRRTGSPVSVKSPSQIRLGQSVRAGDVPGCKVESIIFFASHNSGVMEGILPSL